MTAKRIFLTGASGCIGHYIAETLIQKTDHELFLLVRDPGKLKFDPEARPGITILKADLREIEQFRNILQTTEVAILAATAWGGSGAVFDVNVVKTIRLMNLLNPAVCEQVLYFSTASILNRNNELLPEAGQMGTDYIRSKYDCFRQLPRLAIAPKITTLYPTLVLGGDANHPYSHLSSGLAGVVKWIDLIRFFKVDAGFHFVHAKDIAEVVRHLVDNPPIAEIPGNVSEKALRKKVLGVPAITVNQAVEEICAYLGKRIYFRIPLTMGLANFFIALFRVQMAPWDRFCLNYRHFTHQEPVTPSTYGLPTYCATFADVLRIHGIAPGSKKLEESPRFVEESTMATSDNPVTLEESSRIEEEQTLTKTDNPVPLEESSRLNEELTPTKTDNSVTLEESARLDGVSPIVTTTYHLTPEESPRLGEEQTIAASDNNLPRSESARLVEEQTMATSDNPVTPEASSHFAEEPILTQTDNQLTAEESPIPTTNDRLTPENSPRSGEEPILMKTDSHLTSEESARFGVESPILATHNHLTLEESPIPTTNSPLTPEESLPIVEEPKIATSHNHLPREASLPMAEERPLVKESAANSSLEYREPLVSESFEKTPSVTLEELPFLDPDLRLEKSKPVETLHASEGSELDKVED